MGVFSDLMNPIEHASRKFYDPRKWGKANYADVLLGVGVYAPLQFARDSWVYAADKFFPKPEEPQADITGNKSSNVLKRPVIYGERGKVGGVRVYINTSGANNEYLWVVLDICEGEIEAIDNVYFNDVISTDAKFSGLVTITKYLGTETQAADPGLVSTFSDWTSAHQLKGVAYVVCKFKVSNEAFPGFPTITCDIRGKKVYDPRTTLTTYSGTPALCFRDFFLNKIYGKGAGATLIDDTYVSTAATYQEQQVQEHDATGGTIQLMTCNLYLPTDQKIIDGVRMLLSANRAAFPRVNGKHLLIVEKDDPSVFDFTVDNIIGGWNFAKGDMNSRLNECEVTFTNKLLEWKDDTVQVVSAPLLAEDNQFTLSNSISGMWVTDPYHAKDLADIAIKKSRQQLTCSFLAAPSAVNVIPHSIVTVTHDTPGWNLKKFRVLDVTILPMGLVGVTLIEHEPTVYDRTVPVEAPTPPDTNLPDPDNVAVPTNVQLFSGDNELLLAQDGTVISRIKVTWDAPVGYPYISHYELSYKKSADTVWIPLGTVPYNATLESFTNSVEDGRYYHFQVRVVSLAGKKSSWVSSPNHLVIGKLAPPPSVTTFSVKRQADGTRQFDWAMDNPPPDLAGYKIRYKLGLGFGWDDMEPIHNGLLVSSPYETNVLAAGTYSIAIKAVDTSGNLSSVEKIVQSTLGDPRISGSLLDKDYGSLGWPGTKTDCYADPSSGWLWALGTDTWSSLPPDWNNWGAYEGAPLSSFVYETPPLDLGSVVGYVPLVALSGVGTFTVEESHSDDGVNYSPWGTVGTSLVTSQFIKLRVSVVESSEHGYLSSMSVTLSADSIEEFIPDLDISSLTPCNPSPSCSTAGFRIGVGDFRVPVTKSYAKITQVSVALQGVGPGWSWAIEDKDTLVGPEIKVYNGSVLDDPPYIDVYIKGV